MLTLRPAFVESDRLKLIDRISNGAVPRPRSIDPRIPGDLETIVVKAMARDAGDRYVSARALAEDLERFLADRTILARRSSARERAWRWCRRNPGVAALTGLAATLTVIVAIVSTWSAYRNGRLAARLGAEQALTLAEKSRAEENFRDAQLAVEDCLMRVSDETLIKQQDSSEVRQLRKCLLEDALKYYQRFLARQGNDPRLLADLAYAQSRIAGIHREIGSRPESVSVDQQAAAIWERIVRDNPTDSYARTELAVCLSAVAGGKSYLGLHDESFRAFERSLAILAPFVRANPADNYARRLLGATLTGYGHEQERVGQTTASLRSFQEAVLILEVLVRSDPTDAQSHRKLTGVRPGRPVVATWQRDLANAYRGLGVARQSAGQRALALQSFEKALTIYRVQVRVNPTAIDNHLALAGTISIVGLLLDELGQTTAALRSHHEALAIFDARLRHMSNDAEVQGSRAGTIIWIAALEHKMGRISEAIRSYEQVRASCSGNWLAIIPRLFSTGRPSASATRASPGSTARSDDAQRRWLCWTRPR